MLFYLVDDGVLLHRGVVPGDPDWNELNSPNKK